MATTTTGYDPVRTEREKPAFSVPSIIAIIAVIAMFVTEGFDLALGIVAILFGIIGALVALMPTVRGGFVSILSLVLGLIAIVVSLFQVVF